MTAPLNRTIVAVSHACVLRVNRVIYQALSELGWDVHLVIPDRWESNGNFKAAEPAADGEAGIHVVPLRGQNPRSYQFVGLLSLIREVRPSIVFADVDPVSRMAIELGWLCRKSAIRLAFLSCENLPFDFASIVRREGVRGTIAGGVKQTMGLLSRSRVDHVFTISAEGTRIFRQAGFRSVSQVPLGFSTQLFFPNPESRAAARQGLGVSGIVLAYFGRMVPEKGIHLLLASLRDIADLKWTLLLDHFETRQNSYLAHIAQVTDEPWLRDRVKFIEADHREIADYMNASDVVVMPSVSTSKWKEQYGRVAPEAMACGCVVVAADSGTLPELVADAGVLFPEGDVDALSKAIRGLINDPDRIKTLGDRAAKRARETLSIASQARKMDGVFRDLLSQRACSGP